MCRNGHTYYFKDLHVSIGKYFRPQLPEIELRYSSWFLSQILVCHHDFLGIETSSRYRVNGLITNSYIAPSTRKLYPIYAGGGGVSINNLIYALDPQLQFSSRELAYRSTMWATRLSSGVGFCYQCRILPNIMVVPPDHSVRTVNRNAGSGQSH